MAPPQHTPMRPLTKVLTAHRRIAQQHVLPIITNPLSPMYNTANEETAVIREHRRMQQQHIVPMRPLIKVLATHRKVAQQHIHPARRAMQNTARASNPMQVKQTQARIVRQMQVRPT